LQLGILPNSKIQVKSASWISSTTWQYTRRIDHRPPISAIRRPRRYALLGNGARVQTSEYTYSTLAQPGQDAQLEKELEEGKWWL
jgi:hypothetical protein